MNSPFPKTLVAYEMAVERSLRILRSINPDLPEPSLDDVSDAFFQKIPPGSFATNWLKNAELQILSPPDHTPSDPPPDDTPNLF